MASSGSAAADKDQANYGNVPLTDEEDLVQLKKEQSTAQHSTDGWRNHPALPVACYCFASIMMTVVNKYVVSGVNFNMTCLMLAMQSMFCVGAVVLSKSLGIITIRPFDTNDAKKWFPISFMLATVIYTGSKSLQFLSIPLYTIFKNLTIILIAYGEVIWFGGKVTSLTLVSFAIMVLSSVIAAWSDISSTLGTIKGGWSTLDTGTGAGSISSLTEVSHHFSGGSGYFWMFINCIATAGYVLTMRKRIKITGFSDWDTMFYNNFLSIPVLVVFSFMIEDWGWENLNLNFPAESRNVLLSAIGFSGAAAVGISYTTAWCLRSTSSTTYSMVGALNKLPIAASGMIFFADPVTLGSVTAIGTGFLAGIVYAVARSNQSKADKARKANETVIPLHQR